MKNDNKLNYKLINITAFMLFLYITISNIGTWVNIGASAIQIFLPFIIAFAVAYALTPVVRWLEKQGLPEWLCVLIVVLFLVLLIIFLVAATLPLLYDQLQNLSTNLGSVIDNISDKFDLNLTGVEGNIEHALKNITNDIGNIITSGISKSVGKIGNFIVGFVAAIYFLAYMDNIRAKVKSILQTRNKKMFKYIKVLDLELGNYIKGLFTFMIIQLVEYSILFKIVNHPNWLVLGVLACIMTVVPYFGGLITNIIALILASIASPYTFIGTLIICAIFPQVDGYFTSPKVYGKTNNVNPLITIMAVSIGGTIAGPIGIASALPIYILIRATYNYFERDLKETVKNLKETI